jgi:hypothetical protein
MSGSSGFGSESSRRSDISTVDRFIDAFHVPYGGTAA